MADYKSHAQTAFWLMNEKGHTLKSAINIMAKKHSLVKTKLDKEIRKVMPADFLENRKRAAQSGFLAPLLIDECRPKTL